MSNLPNGLLGKAYAISFPVAVVTITLIVAAFIAFAPAWVIAWIFGAMVLAIICFVFYLVTWRSAGGEG